MTTSDIAAVAAFGVAVGLPVETAVGIAGAAKAAMRGPYRDNPKPKPAPAPRVSPMESTHARDYPRLEASAFGKRRHRRGWATL